MPESSPTFFQPHRTILTPPRTPPSIHGQSAVRVEVVIMTVVNSDLKVMVEKRIEQPFRGTWALPGDFVSINTEKNQGEDLCTAAKRVLRSATGMNDTNRFLEQIYTFGRAGRDPRMRVVSVAWCALVPPELFDGQTNSTVQWFSVSEEAPWIRLAFDHAEILEMGTQHLRNRIDHSTLAFELVPPTFTVGELRDVYDAIMSKRYDPRNFRRRFQRMLTSGLVEAASGKRHLGKSRPAKVWRLSKQIDEKVSKGS